MRNAKFVVGLILLLGLPLFSQNSANLEALKKEAIQQVDARQVFTQQMVDQIFSYAELGFQEFETSRYVTDILTKNGFKVEQGVAGIPTAWMATYGSGKPVIAFITDIDCIPRASQKPGVAYHDPIIEGAPGHGEGHNSGMAVNVTAVLVLRELMEKNKIAGTLKVMPGVAEELLGHEGLLRSRRVCSRTSTLSWAHTWTIRSARNMGIPLRPRAWYLCNISSTDERPTQRALRGMAAALWMRLS